MDNPEYFDGLVPTGGGIPQVGKPLPPDPRTNLNNNIEAMDPLLGKTGKEAAATANSAAPRLQKLGGHSNEAADSYINTDYPDHLGNHTGAQTPLAYMNPRSESAVWWRHTCAVTSVVLTFDTCDKHAFIAECACGLMKSL